jgi:hypothetical protein
MRYRLHTLFMLTDINTMKPKGTTSVKIMEFSAELPIVYKAWKSSADFA